MVAVSNYIDFALNRGKTIAMRDANFNFKLRRHVVICSCMNRESDRCKKKPCKDFLTGNFTILKENLILLSLIHL